jgi:hypothetical protein
MLRNLRLNNLFEDDVNICISRDLDGIISPLDCHNIKVFESNNDLFYVASFDKLNFIVTDQTNSKYIFRDCEKYISNCSF